MTRVNVTLNLPDSVAEQAKLRGLLDSGTIEEWVRREVQAASPRDEFLEHLRRLENDDEEPMSMEEINAIVHEVRAQRRAEADDANRR